MSAPMWRRCNQCGEPSGHAPECPKFTLPDVRSFNVAPRISRRERRAMRRQGIDPESQLPQTTSRTSRATPLPPDPGRVSWR